MPRASGAPASAHEGSAVIEPDLLTCPITRAMFRDPVVTCTGHTFERAALEQFWATTGEGGAPRCPLTNATLTSTAVVPDWSIRQQVSEFLDAPPDYKPDGWTTRRVYPPRKKAAQGHAWQEQEHAADPRHAVELLPTHCVVRIFGRNLVIASFLLLLFTVFEWESTGALSMGRFSNLLLRFAFMLLFAALLTED